MSWKPCRGGRVLLDKAINDSIEYYHKFNEETSIKEKSKCAFKMLKAAIYLNDQKRTINFFGEQFIAQCKQHQNVTYKPFLNLLAKCNL
jgi:outer membrane protein assembly factor BamD (BamD/ComL family)